MMIAKIIQRSKLANQGAPNQKNSWFIEYPAHNGSLFNDVETGWLSMNGTASEVKLKFPTQESAEEFAKSNNIKYELVKPNNKKLIKRSYSDNFK